MTTANTGLAVGQLTTQQHLFPEPMKREGPASAGQQVATMLVRPVAVLARVLK